MKELSLSDRLVRYLQKHHGFIASGDLQRIVMEHTTYTPRTTCRRLQELVNEGKLEVQYRTHNGVRHAFYRAPSFQEENQAKLDYFHSLPVAK